MSTDGTSGTTVARRRRPIDPDSDRGRAATAALAQIFAGVELRKARRDSKAGTASTP